MSAERPPCGHHDSIREILDDHESRLREKRDRILALEMEAKHMREKLDLLVQQNDQIKAGVDSLKQWQLYLMGGAGAVAVIYSLLSAHWSTIVRVIGGGG